jgi:hypothetical protein
MVFSGALKFVLGGTVDADAEFLPFRNLARAAAGPVIGL